ncbi:MAG: addiction module antidote protein, HigA family [Planctomycetota bacterium]|nr:MAG: addiction module antidote protein, HigA family [Planctomycetota bacterium]
MTTTLLPAVHPGEMLVEEFLKPLGLTQTRLAAETGLPLARINQICLGKRSITADTDLRLCRYFGLSEGWWLRLQTHHDLEIAKRHLGPRLNKECRVLAKKNGRLVLS